MESRTVASDGGATEGSTGAAPGTSASVYFHTNRPVRTAPDHLGFAKVTTGWDYDPARAAQDMRRVRGKTRSTRWLMQTYKYAWLLNASSHGRPGSSSLSEPLVLIDTDTVVQCSARELAERFAAFDTPLVVGGEPSWWPQPDFRGFDPWAAQQLPRGTHARYPNSGMLFGTRAAMRRLVGIFRRWPRYPCCPVHMPHAPAAGELRGKRPSASALSDFHSQSNASASCLVEDQHCLQAALRTLRLGVDYKIDTEASLALNLNALPDYRRTLPRAPDGWRIMYAPRNTTPCVLHFNGYAKGGVASKGTPPMRQFIVESISPRAWVPSEAVEAGAWPNGKWGGKKEVPKSV